MKIVRDIYDKMLEEKQVFEEKMSGVIYLREQAKSEGDLKENADYIKACGDLEQLNLSYQKIMKILDDGYPVDVTTEFNSIDVGCKFKLKAKLKSESEEIDGDIGNVGVFNISNSNDGVLLDAVVTVAGDVSDYLLDGYISTSSTMGKFLIGKTVGTYQMSTSSEDLVIIEVSKL